ncbi:MAG: hypothetical protein A2Y33_09290 [Spirochaetes bacterium GWF1_51_8]|nr:MAG: hypothetical protein A2Y33_09290 [Spirochaetes bacterium GWF1_51_8]
MKGLSLFTGILIALSTLSCGGQAVKKQDKPSDTASAQDKIAQGFDLTGKTGGKAVKSPLPPDHDKYQNSKSAPVQVYLGGEDTLKLSPVPSVIGYSLPFAGWTKYKILWIQIKSSGGKSHDIKFMPDWDGNFNVYYLLKDGAGNYKVTVFGADSIDAKTFQALAAFGVQSEKDIPQDKKKLFLNPYVLAFVDANMGQQVGRGECWDLAQAALDLFSADWVRTTDFGIPLDPEKDEILPGDIIQFSTVKITIKTKNGTTWETYGSPDHTAIVYKVLGKLHYEVAHQNVMNKKTVLVSELDLNYKTSGQVWFYRPVMGLVQN